MGWVGTLCWRPAPTAPSVGRGGFPHLLRQEPTGGTPALGTGLPFTGGPVTGVPSCSPDIDVPLPLVAMVVSSAVPGSDVLYAMHRLSGLKIWHALVVLAIGAYLTAFIFGAQITAFLSRIPALFGR